MSKPKGIITGQRVSAAKVERSRELRREMTNAERMLWQHLRGGRLHGLKFRRQQVIDGFIVDFYCHAAGLVVEVDGAVHQAQAAYDERRTRVLKMRDLRVLRLPNDQIEQHIEGVLEHIAEQCGVFRASAEKREGLDSYQRRLTE
jgi:very-short-patch-repair endonuclease